MRTIIAAARAVRTAGRLLLACVGVLFCGVGAAQALTISIDDVFDDATRAKCSGIYINCRSDAFLHDTTVKFGDGQFEARFEIAFDAWNATNAAGSEWTLADGGELEGELDVEVFIAAAEETVGGLDIRILIDSYTPGVGDPARNDLVWSQGLRDNYLLDGSIVPPFFEMDINSNCAPANPGVFCPPVYPFQYDDEHFFDGPRAPWPDSFFEATAFLSTVDYTNRVLTVYEGVEYAFYLSAEVPEPETILLFAFGLLGLAALARSRRA